MARLNCAPSQVAGSYSKKYLTSPLLSEDGQQNYSERKKRDSKFADPHWSPRWREKISGWASLCSRWKEKISDCASLRYRYAENMRKIFAVPKRALCFLCNRISICKRIIDHDQFRSIVRYVWLFAKTRKIKIFEDGSPS